MRQLSARCKQQSTAEQEAVRLSVEAKSNATTEAAKKLSNNKYRGGGNQNKSMEYREEEETVD